MSPKERYEALVARHNMSTKLGIKPTQEYMDTGVPPITHGTQLELDLGDVSNIDTDMAEALLNGLHYDSDHSLS